MEKNLTLPASRFTVASIANHVMNLVQAPVEALRQYYAHVLERDINLRQTWLLINAQTAFFFTAFPVECPLLVRLLCCTWLVHALLLCKKAFA
ncbi:MAG: ATP-binding protein [Prevotella sp.]|nr:ATP-binding protein [Prevotella sp.]